MNLIEGSLYHVFNRGNNGERIFYKSSNYLFFVQKIRHHILPYAEVLSWCLMPNHFHLMILVHHQMVKSKTINQSIGTMLCSYARAINIQENRKGSLFQQHTKSLCLNGNETLNPAWYKIMGVTKINRRDEKAEYPTVCMNYIHLNPVQAGIVIDVRKWPWSSYQEIYLKNTNIELVNLEALKAVVRL